MHGFHLGTQRRLTRKHFPDDDLAFGQKEVQRKAGSAINMAMLGCPPVGSEKAVNISRSGPTACTISEISVCSDLSCIRIACIGGAA